MITVILAIGFGFSVGVVWRDGRDWYFMNHRGEP